MARNKYYSGPPSDHFDGERFFNPSGTKPKGFKQLLKWQLESTSAKWPASFPSPYHDHPPARVGDDGVRVSFIGHASYLIQGNGLSILIDPVFSERASPTQFAGPKRVNPPGVSFSALPKIDIVLITHSPRFGAATGRSSSHRSVTTSSYAKASDRLTSHRSIGISRLTSVVAALSTRFRRSIGRHGASAIGCMRSGGASC